MYTYISLCDIALSEFFAKEVITDYSMYVSEVLRRKHYRKTRKYRR